MLKTLIIWTLKYENLFYLSYDCGVNKAWLWIVLERKENMLYKACEWDASTTADKRKWTLIT